MVKFKVFSVFKAFECFLSTFQGKFSFQRYFKTILYILTFQACANPALNLHAALRPPIKIQLNQTNGSGQLQDVFQRISSVPTHWLEQF